MTASPAAIRFAGVGQVFQTKSGALEALRGVDMTIDRHEFVAVLGPSGCGKSTLLRLTSGLLMPTRGTVEVFGRKITEPRDDIGIVFQRPTLLPWATIEDNVVFPVRHKTGSVGPADRKTAQALLEKVGLKGFEKRLPDELSGGMQQRVGIVRGIIHDPAVILMDEPFAALDAMTREYMSHELQSLWMREPKSILFITHSIPEAVFLADRVVVLNPRPATVREVVEVDIPRPRRIETMTEKKFTDISQHLREIFAQMQG